MARDLYSPVVMLDSSRLTRNSIHEQHNNIITGAVIQWFWARLVTQEDLKPRLVAKAAIL